MRKKRFLSRSILKLVSNKDRVFRRVLIRGRFKEILPFRDFLPIWEIILVIVVIFDYRILQARAISQQLQEDMMLEGDDASQAKLHGTLVRGNIVSSDFVRLSKNEVEDKVVARNVIVILKHVLLVLVGSSFTIIGKEIDRSVGDMHFHIIFIYIV